MKLREYLHLILTLPPHIVVKKGTFLIRRKIYEKYQAARDTLKSTYGNLPSTLDREYTLAQYFEPPPSESLKRQKQAVFFLADKFLNHEFNLLGSGWTSVYYGMTCPGLEGIGYNGIVTSVDAQGLVSKINRANRAHAKTVYSLIGNEYTPIDWHIDFKSGFRWPVAISCKHISYGYQPGADVKVPWELSRMQHLPQFAFAFHLATEAPDDKRPPEQYLQEFQHQTLDFIALNPPRYGVNWACTMDVAIRAANWAITLDLFQAYGASFSNDFTITLVASMQDHGDYIINNLEWSEELRSNHYLANICGLLFIAAYLPQSTRTDNWLAFAMEQLSLEIQLQFQKDGSNFEASTSYHRLSAEMVIYTVMLAHLIPKKRLASLPVWTRAGLGHTGPGPIPLQEPDHAQTRSYLFSQACYQQLYAIIDFTYALTFPDGNNVQIGDNDSGRFLKLFPAISTPGKPFGEENSLDHGHLIAAFYGFLGLALPVKLTRSCESEHMMACSIAQRCHAPLPIIQHPPKLSEASFRLFPDFGVYVYQREGYYISLRCGSVGQRGNGGHAHNDQLSLTAAFDGESFFIDPGTYLYTPLPDKRNQFRSTAMHNTLHLQGLEQHGWAKGNLGLFSLQTEGTPEIIANTIDTITGEWRNNDYCHRRTIEITRQGMRIKDITTRAGATVVFQLASGVKVNLDSKIPCSATLTKNDVSIYLIARTSTLIVSSSLFSKGYGEVEDNLCLQISLADAIELTVDIYIQQ